MILIINVRAKLRDPENTKHSRNEELPLSRSNFIFLPAETSETKKNPKTSGFKHFVNNSADK